GGLQAVHHRHADVHEDDVGAQVGDPGDGLLAVDGLADHLDVGLRVEQDGEARPDHALVVGHQHADRHVSSSGWRTGRTAATRNPPSPVGPASRLPPSIVARSRMPTRPCPPPAAQVPLATSTEATPSLRISSVRLSGRYATCTCTRAPGACRIALLSASCTIRYADRSTPSGRSTGFPLQVTATDTPPLRAESSRVSSSASPGCGVVPATPVRSTPSTRRSSPRPASALARISPKLSTSSGGGSAVLYGAASAWIAITDMWCATTSCSSRAIRCRSSSSARSPECRRSVS